MPNAFCSVSAYLLPCAKTPIPWLETAAVTDVMRERIARQPKKRYLDRLDLDEGDGAVAVGRRGAHTVVTFESRCCETLICCSGAPSGHEVDVDTKGSAPPQVPSDNAVSNRVAAPPQKDTMSAHATQRETTDRAGGERMDQRLEKLESSKTTDANEKQGGHRQSAPPEKAARTLG